MGLTVAVVVLAFACATAGRCLWFDGRRCFCAKLHGVHRLDSGCGFSGSCRYIDMAAEKDNTSLTSMACGLRQRGNLITSPARFV